MQKNILNITLNQLLKVRLHLGHKINSLNSKMTVYILGQRHSITIFDVEKILYSLKIFFSLIVEVIKYRGFFFIVGSNKKIPIADLLSKFLKKYQVNNNNNISNFNIIGYSTLKWMGGLFTNWNVTRDFINYMLKSSKKNSKRYKTYLERLEGVNILNNKIIPDFLITFDSNHDVIKEAKNLEIPVIGLADSNSDPDNFLYTLIGNDDSLESLQFIYFFIEEAIKEGKLKEQEQFLFFFIKKIQQNCYNN